jgi:hypothetical protein
MKRHYHGKDAGSSRCASNSSDKLSRSICFSRLTAERHAPAVRTELQSDFTRNTRLKAGCLPCGATRRASVYGACAGVQTSAAICAAGRKLLVQLRRICTLLQPAAVLAATFMVAFYVNAYIMQQMKHCRRGSRQQLDVGRRQMLWCQG